MSLQPGQDLAHYRIDRKIGEGGMGEVWAATDTRLNRQVAIKSLPPAVAADETRMGRFTREAQLLAALSHPNIAAIYGLEQVDGASYLALELVEGDDLTARIEGRRVPYGEAKEIALQIAAGLEEAHDKGIIHRDLKPANIKLSDDGKLKILDFGLAKALSEDPNSSFDSMDLSTSPTMTAAMGTQAGMILGTAAYMAPEQARGKAVDRRADIWAFGVILFEMLTGERMYQGETVTDIIAAVVTREPEWDRLPADTPVAMRRVLRRCLTKDPRNRLRDIGDAALELREEHADEFVVAADTTRPSRRTAWAIGAAGLALGLILATVLASLGGSTETTAQPTWTNLASPAGIEFRFGDILELSPDGRKVVFVAMPPEGEEAMLWVRDLGEDQARILEGTEGAIQPFWSPDSKSIGYFAKRRLRRIAADGGPSTDLDNVGDAPRGGHWSHDGTILFGPDWSQPLYRVPATGGTPRAITELNDERLELSHRWPFALPDGKHFLFYAVSTYPALNPDTPSEIDKSGLYIGSYDGDEPRLLQTVRSRAAYVDGALLFVNDNVLMMRPFDLASLSFHGDAVALIEDVTQSAGALWGGALFSVSNEGTLMFVRGARETTAPSLLTWIDRKGNEIGVTGEPAPFNDVDLSPDDSRLAASIGEPSDVWIFDLARDTSTRFTFDLGNDDSALWSPDGDRVIFQSSRVISGQRFTPDNIFIKAASGQENEQPVPIGGRGPSLQPSSWSPDATTVAVTAFSPTSGSDILLYSFETEELEEYLTNQGDTSSAKFSPDGRWLAYTSAESGSAEIYVAAYPGPGGKWQVSSGGGRQPAWRSDGTELFYVTDDDALMAVPVETGDAFRHGTPVKLFQAPKLLRIGANQTWDAGSDGSRFVFLALGEESESEPGTVGLVQNWQELAE
jgi:Tol biopolymer transport system component/tRNA A-37 threonylcarbamoyl transferase component Bud32